MNLDTEVETRSYLGMSDKDIGEFESDGRHTCSLYPVRGLDFPSWRQKEVHFYHSRVWPDKGTLNVFLDIET